MSSIGSISSYGSSMISGMGGRPRPDPAKMAEDLFSQIDTKGQGYIEKSDLQSAFAQISGSGEADSGASVDDIFAQLDGDGDGKVTRNEMSDSLQKLADQLDSQFDQMRMAGGMGGMPPAPPQDDAGFSKDQLQGQLDEIGGTDSKRAELIAKVVDNFDEADTDSDGKVSFKEAMAYDQQGQDGAPATSAASDASNASATGNDRAVLQRIMQLMHAYAGGEQGVLSGTLSVSA